ncbi:MAG TPA: sulfurtransferase TusA family protein [Symbiobacteriaceae bacterium]|nr:sulfurtransferase TusA family protein [Symbiobacteriaceae bacterium]
MTVALTVDARGLACPMPIVKAKKGIDKLESGQVLELLTTDRGSGNDLPAWVKTGGHELLETRLEEGVFHFLIRKG